VLRRELKRKSVSYLTEAYRRRVIPSHLTRLTKAMGRPRNKAQQAQDEGDRIRRTIINWLADKITDPSGPLTTEEMNHLRMVTAYFPEGRETAEKIDRIFGDTKAFSNAPLALPIGSRLQQAQPLSSVR
jgi:hypothetical protein